MKTVYINMKNKLPHKVSLCTPKRLNKGETVSKVTLRNKQNIYSYSH